MTEAKKTVLGQLLRQARRAAGLSQQTLAARAGLDVSYISRLERGNRRPRRQALIKLAAALQLSQTELENWLVLCDLAPITLLNRLAIPAPATETDATRVAVQEPLEWQQLGLEEIALRRLLQAGATAAVARRERVAAVLRQVLERLVAELRLPVSWAVIPAAGGQHRLLAQPVMQQLLLRAIGEAAALGISRFLVILAPGTVDTLWRPLQLALSLAVAPRFELHYCLQPEPTGLGAAVQLAAPWIQDEPFLVLLPDEMLTPRPARAWDQELAQMAEAYPRQPPVALVAVARTARQNLPAGGVARLGPAVGPGKVYQILELVEKPPLEQPICQSPAARTIVGRYLLPPQIFAALQDLQATGPAILELTAALELLRQQGTPVWGYELQAPKRDLGGVLGQAEALIYQ